MQRHPATNSTHKIAAIALTLVFLFLIPVRSFRGRTRRLGERPEPVSRRSLFLFRKTAFFPSCDFIIHEVLSDKKDRRGKMRNKQKTELFHGGNTVLEAEVIGDKGDEFGVCRLAAACLHGVSEI